MELYILTLQHKYRQGGIVLLLKPNGVEEDYVIHALDNNKSTSITLYNGDTFWLNPIDYVGATLTKLSNEREAYAAHDYIMDNSETTGKEFIGLHYIARAEGRK